MQMREGDVVLEPSLVDLGDIRLNASVDFQARVINRSGREVQIESVSAGCGCSRIEIDCSRLASGAAATLSGTLRTSATPGILERPITMETPGGERVVAGTLRANVRRMLRWRPETLVVRPDVIRGSEADGEFVIENHSDEPVTLQAPRFASPTVTAEGAAQEIPPQGSVRLHVRARNTSVSPQSVELTVGTSLPSEGILTLPVVIRPVEFVEALPRTVHFGVVRRAELRRRSDVTVRLRGPMLRQVMLESVATPPYLDLVPTDSAAGDVWTFRFRTSDTFDGGTLAGAIRFHLRHRETNETFPVDVAVHGFLIEELKPDREKEV
ncbi:MAG: DUF1573 domain-containing protein [Planctomycetes bacterium]|nr:DUF1573 domain-containing protein [Planctomycetota bacterium]